jgi:hypothetical protein
MVDLIRSGRAPDVIRRKGAEGTLPLPAEEKIEILTLLAKGPEAELREKALETLRKWDSAELRRVMASPLTARVVLHFAAEQLLEGREELREVLLWNPSLPAETREMLETTPALRAEVVEVAEGTPGQPQVEPPYEPAVWQTTAASSGTPQPDLVPSTPAEEVTMETLAKIAGGSYGEQAAASPGAQVETPPEVSKRDDELTQKDRETLIEKINRMSAVEKIKAALTGNQETRMILVRDSNKIVSRAVLQSPKLSDTEIEGYAAAKNVSEEVLRLIAMNRKFMKTYVVLRALINNPRAPIDITMPLINRLNERDLKGLALNRNVPEVIRSMAIKLIKQKAEASKPKLPGKH